MDDLTALEAILTLVVFGISLSISLTSGFDNGFVLEKRTFVTNDRFCFFIAKFKPNGNIEYYIAFTLPFTFQNVIVPAAFDSVHPAPPPP